MPIRTSFVIGNGESRQGIDLNACKKLGLTVGCNAIVRDFQPHLLSAADQRMLDQIRASEYQGKVYTRPDWNQKYTAEKYPDLPYHGDKREDNAWHWNSGPHAVNIACVSKHAGWFGKTTSLVFLLGFDMTQNDKVNNVYKATDGYDNKVVNPKYWHYQLNKLYQHYLDITFVWIAPDSYTCPAEWSNNENFYRESVQQFNQFIHDFKQNHKLLDQFQPQ